jgi:hypothetical protein
LSDIAREVSLLFQVLGSKFGHFPLEVLSQGIKLGFSDGGPGGLTLVTELVLVLNEREEMRGRAEEMREVGLGRFWDSLRAAEVVES